MTPQVLELMLWLVGTPCAAHDIHNGLKRSMHAHFKDLLLMKNVYLATLGIRKAFDLILKYLSWGTLSVLVFAEPGWYPSQAFQYKFWDFLGSDSCTCKDLGGGCQALV